VSDSASNVLSRAVHALALALALAGAAGAAGTSNPQAAKFYEDALVRYEKKDIAGAIIQLKNAIKEDRNMLPVHVLLGRALLADGQVNPAEVAFDEALRLGVNRAEVVVPLAEAVMGQARPNDVLAQGRFADAGLPVTVRASLLIIKANASADIGNPRDAIRLIEEARALDPSRAESWIAEVPIRLRARQFKEAQAAADRALAMAPDSSNALLQRASVSHLQGDLKAAMTYYDRALKLAPTATEGLVSRAGLLMDLKRYDEAAKDVEALRRSSPSDPRGAYIGALLSERAGDKAAMRAALAEVTGLLDPVPIEYMRYRVQFLMLGGLAHHGLNQPEKARPYLEMVLRQQPGSGVAKLLAQIYLKDKNYDRAAEVLDVYLRGHPDDQQAIHLLASVHLSQGRYARAAQLTQDALNKRDDPALRGLLGRSLLGVGKLPDAVSQLEAAFKQDPGQWQTGAMLASLYLGSQQSDRAIAMADRLIKVQPQNAGLYNLLGAARYQKGDAPGARAAYEQALKLAPDVAVTQINMARLEIEQKALDAATARLNAVLVKEPQNIDALLEMANAAAKRNNLADTQRWLEKADSVSGNNIQPGLRLVEFHLDASRPDRAREVMKTVQGKAPDSLLVLLANARVLLANNDAPAARSSLNRAAAAANFDAASLVQVAALQLQAGNVPGAAFALDKALSERPDHLLARSLMADVELRQGEPAKAEQRARGLIASHPKLGVGHALLGDVALARGNRAAAMDAYRRAHDLDRNSASLLRLFNATAAGSPTAAVQLAEQWLKTRPADIQVRRALAHTLARAGNLPAARATFEALLKAAPNDADALNDLANVMLMQRDPAALAIAERALALKPELPYVIGTTGWASFKAGQSDRALQLLRDARLRDPTNPDTRYFLGAVLADRGRAAEARDELQGALKGNRVTAYAKEAQALLLTLR